MVRHCQHTSTFGSFARGRGVGRAFTDEQSVAPSGQGRNSSPAAPLEVLGAVSSSTWLTEALYRILEFSIAAIGLMLSLPQMLLIGLLVRCDSGGPALFVHTRPGRSKMKWGRELEDRLDLEPPPGGFKADRLYYPPSYFRLVKFRTIFSDARERFPELYAYDFAHWEFHRQHPTLQDDPRITRLGATLRRMSLDELPNLWSVVGDMRLVGPRPKRRRYCTTTARRRRTNSSASPASPVWRKSIVAGCSIGARPWRGILNMSAREMFGST
jgi:lipopolysaccharide/colanic/teichoic acid biosynthesis glycosyltransferase